MTLRTRPPLAAALSEEGSTVELVELELTRYHLRVLAAELDAYRIGDGLRLPKPLATELAAQVGAVVDELEEDPRG